LQPIAGMITQLAGESPLVARVARAKQVEPETETPHDPETGEVHEPTREREPGEDDEDELPDEFA